MLLENQIALVTGASRGIGKAIAQRMGAEGTTVIGTATSESGAEAISGYLRDSGVKGAGKVLNVNEAESIPALVKEINEAFGAVTVLVNNAGITRDNLLLRMKDDEWDDIIATNLTSIFRMTKACVRGMLKNRGGRVINIASVVGATGNAGQSNYAAAKAGIGGFSRSLASELGARGITVNTIAPGFIASDMTDALPDAQKEALMGGIALGRLGQPEEIAHAAVFLASEHASYITGHTLHVNGGMYMN